MSTLIDALRQRAEVTELAASGVYLHSLHVVWGQCDPAGIVYFPRFFEMFHEAMEGWFEACLGMSYAHVIVERKLGFPSVHTEADFRKPASFGDRIVVELRVGKLGRSSLQLDYVLRAEADAEDIRATGRSVCVVMDLDPRRPRYRKSVALPDDLRVAIESFQQASE